MTPDSVPDIDRRLARSLRGSHQARWTGVAVLAVVVTIAIAVFSWLVIVQQQRLVASCQFYRLIATLPIASKPTPGRPLILFVLDSRAAYEGQGCGGLPPASPGLLHWAAHYNIKVRP